MRSRDYGRRFLSDPREKLPGHGRYEGFTSLVTKTLPWKSTSEANSRSGRNETRSMTPQPKANAVKPAHRSPPRVVLEFFFQLARENLAKRRIRAARSEERRV